MIQSMIQIILALCMVQCLYANPRTLQFSHFVPQYLPDVPAQLARFVTPTGNVIDPYVRVNDVNTNTVQRGQSFEILPIRQPQIRTIQDQCRRNGRVYNPNTNTCDVANRGNGDTSIIGDILSGFGNIIGGNTGGGSTGGGSTGGGNTGGGSTGGGGYTGGPDPNTPTCPLLPIQSFPFSNSLLDLTQISRTYDGSNNNPTFSQWGATNTPMDRRSQTSYTDGIKQPPTNLPNARRVSNTIGSNSQGNPSNRLNLSASFTIFGQFLDHDVDLTEAQSGPGSQHMDIPIPAGDPFFSQPKIQFTRSQFIHGAGIRKFPNMITSWVDGSQVYGSDPLTNCILRSFRNGKLKTTPGDNLLPKIGGQFRAGDIRAIQNLVLAGYHTIFMRQHNRMCDRILAQYPTLNDEEVFQAARNYVIGLLQKIVYKQFLPKLLGDAYNSQIGPYFGYNPSVNPTIPIEFSTAAFRVGHTLLVSKFKKITQFGTNVGDIKLQDMFFAQNIITSSNIDLIFKGLQFTKMKQKTVRIIDDVRNLLVLDPTNQAVKLDLYALNLQRGRDHGLGSYNKVRQAYGLPALNSFADLLPLTPENLILGVNLSNLYGGVNSIDKLDLFVGIIAEQPVNNGVLGELGVRIVGQAFKNLRDGDRFWYENAYPASIRSEIDGTTLSDIVMRNTGVIGLPSDFFKAS